MAIGAFNRSSSIILLIQSAQPRRNMILLAKNILFDYILPTTRLLSYSMPFDSPMTMKKGVTVK